MKKPKRSAPRISMQSSIYDDLTIHMMNKVSRAAMDVVQLADTPHEMVALHISGMLALLTQAVANSAPETATRAEIVLIVKAATDAVATKFLTSLDKLGEEEFIKMLRSHKKTRI